MPAYIKKPLSFNQRRNIARIETGRYTIPRLPEESRSCLACSQDEPLVLVNGAQTESRPVESESHFLFDCVAYDSERANYFSKMNLPDNFESMSYEDKLKLVLNHPFNVRFTSEFIFVALNVRSRILNN